MSKETLQGYNTRLINNNTNLDEVLNLVNSLPEDIPMVFQDKSIEITESGTQTITPDKGYDALSSVEVTSNVAEDLSEELTIQSENLVAQETSIASVIEVLQSKAVSGAKGGLNIFVQEDEPSSKEGLWLQTNKRYDKITFAEITSGDDWIYDRDKATIPYTFKEGNGVQIDDAVYIFGGAGGQTTAYKYDIVNDKYTQLSGIPVAFRYEPCTALGTNVYLSCAIGASNVGNQLWKYDTLTNAYTQLTSRPQPNTGSNIIAVGDSTLYSWGCDWGESYGKHGYKYDIKSNYWKEIATPPIAFAYPALCAMGTDVYIFGSGYSNNQNYYVYKYDTINDTYTSLINAPCYIREAIAKNEKEIYVVGCDGSGNKTNPRLYSYNIDLDTYTLLTALPYYINCDSAIAIYDNELMIFGGETETTTVLTVESNVKDFNDRSIVIDWNRKTTNTYSFKIVDFSKITNDFDSLFKFYFHNVFYCESNNELDDTIPTYYGDGTQWIKFKN